MTLFLAVLASWLLLTVPVSVLMGKCISRGLMSPSAAAATDALAVPAQRPAPAHAAGTRMLA